MKSEALISVLLCNALQLVESLIIFDLGTCFKSVLHVALGVTSCRHQEPLCDTKCVCVCVTPSAP